MVVLAAGVKGVSTLGSTLSVRPAPAAPAAPAVSLSGCIACSLGRLLQAAPVSYELGGKLGR